MSGLRAIAGRIAARPAGLIRFTCLHNSANAICQVVELEVYSD